MVVLVGCVFQLVYQFLVSKDESRKLEENVQPSVAVETASVVAETAKEVVVTSAGELKGIEAKTIIWKRDSAKMVWVPNELTRNRNVTEEDDS